MTRANAPATGDRQSATPAARAGLPVAVAPALSAVGLVLVAAASYVLIGGSLPTVPGGGPSGPSGPGGPVRTATPSNVVIVPQDPRTKVPGSLLYRPDCGGMLQ